MNRMPNFISAQPKQKVWSGGGELRQKKYVSVGKLIEVALNME